MSDRPSGADGRAASLRALAAGRLADWPGLPPGCTRDVVEAALGPSGEGPDGSGQLGPSPAAFRRYPAAPAAPYGLTVWFAGDDAALVEINTPSLAEPPEAQLGPPEAEAPSGLDRLHTQLIYAGRGLAVHVHQFTRAPRRVYAFPPTSVEAFLQSWLSRVEIGRVPHS